VDLSFANIFVGAKHDRSKSLMITNKLSAVMLRPYKIEMHPPHPVFANKSVAKALWSTVNRQLSKTQLLQSDPPQLATKYYRENYS
jgi:hypothetical protein